MHLAVSTGPDTQVPVTCERRARPGKRGGLVKVCVLWLLVGYKRRFTSFPSRDRLSCGKLIALLPCPSSPKEIPEACPHFRMEGGCHCPSQMRISVAATMNQEQLPEQQGRTAQCARRQDICSPSSGTRPPQEAAGWGGGVGGHSGAEGGHGANTQKRSYKEGE